MNVTFQADKYNPDWVSVLVELPGESPIKVEENISYKVKNPSEDQLLEWQQKAEQIKQKEELNKNYDMFCQAEALIKTKYPKKFINNTSWDKIRLSFKNGKLYREFLVSDILAGKY